MAGGLVLGLGTALSDTQAGGLDQSAGSRAISMALNSPTIWACLALIAGWLVAPLSRSAGAGLVGVVAGLVSYFVVGATVGDRQAVSTSALLAQATGWIVLGAAMGVLLGVGGGLIRSRSSLRGLVVGAVVVGAVLDMVVLRRLGPTTFQVDPAMALAQCAVVVTAVVLGLGLLGTRPFGSGDVDPQ